MYVKLEVLKVFFVSFLTEQSTFEKRKKMLGPFHFVHYAPHKYFQFFSSNKQKKKKRSQQSNTPQNNNIHPTHGTMVKNSASSHPNDTVRHTTTTFTRISLPINSYDVSHDPSHEEEGTTGGNCQALYPQMR